MERPGPYPAGNSPPDCSIEMVRSPIYYVSGVVTGTGIDGLGFASYGAAGALPGREQSTGLFH